MTLTRKIIRVKGPGAFALAGAADQRISSSLDRRAIGQLPNVTGAPAPRCNQASPSTPITCSPQTRARATAQAGRRRFVPEAVAKKPCSNVGSSWQLHVGCRWSRARPSVTPRTSERNGPALLRRSRPATASHRITVSQARRMTRG